MEYMALIVFILGALFVFQKYIKRALSGGWKAAGDTFGHGRQYDPRWFGRAGEEGGTLECFYSTRVDLWINERCYDLNCDCTIPPTDPGYTTECLDCLRFTCSENTTEGLFCRD